MAERADVDVRGERCIRQHDIEFVHGEIRGQAVERAFAAREPYRAPQGGGRPQDAVRDLLGDDVVDADHESQRAFARTLLDRIQQLTADPEDLVSVAIHQAAHLRGHELPP
jgi:hypothetical protein